MDNYNCNNNYLPHTMEYYDEESSSNHMDDCDSEKNITAIDYVDEDSYELFEREIRIEVRNQIVSIRNLNDCYQLDMSRALCDYFCKLMIYSFAESSEKMTPRDLYKGVGSHKLIKSGNYTKWKGAFIESGFARNFGVNGKAYQIKGVKELLNCTAICVVLLYEYISENWDEEEDVLNEIDSLGDVYKKIMKAYNDGKKQTNLSIEEKNEISYLLFRKHLEEDERISPYVRTRMRQSNWDITKEEAKKIIENILEAGQELCEEYEMSEEEIFLDRCVNSDDRQILFSKYLAPIMAAVCIFFSTDVFLTDSNIWKRSKKWKKINTDWILTDNAKITEEMQRQMSYNFNMLLQYIRYRKKINDMREQKDFLDKYYYFYYLMLYKIGCSDNRMIDIDYRFIQYYVTEQLMKWELIKIETDIIFEVISNDSEMNDLYDFGRKYSSFGRILHSLSRLDGVIMRIELAERIIRDFFDTCPGNDKVKNRKCTEDFLHMIEYEQMIYERGLRNFLETGMGYSTEKNKSVLRKNLMEERVHCYGKDRQTYFMQTQSYLKEKINLADFLVKNYSSKKNVYANIKKYASSKVGELNKLRKNIEIWVISSNFCDLADHKFEFVD